MHWRFYSQWICFISVHIYLSVHDLLSCCCLFLHCMLAFLQKSVKRFIFNRIWVTVTDPLRSGNPRTGNSPAEDRVHQRSSQLQQSGKPAGPDSGLENTENTSQFYKRTSSHLILQWWTCYHNKNVNLQITRYKVIDVHLLGVHEVDSTCCLAANKAHDIYTQFHPVIIKSVSKAEELDMLNRS